MPVSIEPIGDIRANLGESPLWSPAEGALYWVDIGACRIFRQVLASGAVAEVTLPTEAGSIGLCASGGLVAATRGGFRSVDFRTGAVSMIADPEPEFSTNRLNDGKVDRRGRFWAGSMQDPGFAPVGRLYRLERGKIQAAPISQIRIPNALCWSPDSRTMYFADSLSREIWSFEYDLAVGEFGAKRVFARIPEEHGVPDGATVDADGFVWSAHMDGSRVTRYDPDGSIERTVPLPVSRVTSVAFGGPHLDIMFVTTATRRLTPEQLSQQPNAGRVLAVHGLGVRGLAEPAYIE